MKETGKNKAKRMKNKNKKRWITLIFFIILVISTVLLCKTIFERDELIGLWDIDGTTKYEFDGKGNGKLIVPAEEFIFSYKLNSDEISIDFESKSARDVTYTYKKEGNKLRFIGKSGSTIDIELKREK